MRVTFFDVEYANTKNKSICQIGLLSKDIHNPKIEEIAKEILVNPEDHFEKNCSNIHKITPETVLNAPNFKDVWGEIEPYFTNAVVIGHNARFKALDALYKNLIRYGIDVPIMYYLCTAEIAKMVIPSIAIPDYSLRTLCEYFDIKHSNQHNAFFQACECSDLLDILKKTYSKINIEREVKKYVPEESENHISFVSNGLLKKAIHDFYGILTGFSLDSNVSEEEKLYIIEWRSRYSGYLIHEDFWQITKIIDIILEDGKITIDELKKLQFTVKRYLDVISTSTLTLSTQILSGILKGIILDEKITEYECQQLRDWLYENQYMSGHFPYDKLLESIEKVLEDTILTSEEFAWIKNEIENLLNPIEILTKRVDSLNDIIGVFENSGETATQRYVIESNTIDAKEENNEREKYKEIEKINSEKDFKELLFSFIKASGLKENEVYKKANVHRQTMYKIRRDPKYKPSKSTVCAFAIVLKLTVNQTNELLNAIGYNLSSKLEFDCIIQKFLEDGCDDIIEVNNTLYEKGLSLLTK